MPTSCAEAVRPRVRAVHPACAVWPANILRIHVVFDRPMDRDGALAHLRIETAVGTGVEGVFVDMRDGLWTPDQCVLTALFHPARIKTGLGAHLRRGRALLPGHGYTLVVDGAMADAEGRLIGQDHRVTFRAGSVVESPIDVACWRFAQPQVRSRVPLSIETDRPIDAMGAPLALGLRCDDGASVPATFEAAGLVILARPLAPWPKSPVVLTAATGLEDVCGNRLGEALGRLAPLG